jgi:histidine triad (HIT) family protein
MLADVAACAFCEIVAGREAAHVVLRTPDVVAFLDRRPLFPGHVLVMPADHVPDLLALPAGSPLFAEVQRIAGAVMTSLGADGTFVALNNRVSQSVPHLHVHVVPRRKGDGLRGFFWPRGRYRDDDEMVVTAARIAAALEIT